MGRNSIVVFNCSRLIEAGVKRKRCERASVSSDHSFCFPATARVVSAAEELKSHGYRK